MDHIGQHRPMPPRRRHAPANAPKLLIQCTLSRWRLETFEFLRRQNYSADLEELQIPTTQGFTSGTQSNDPLDLAIATIHNLHLSHPTAMQQTALADWHLWWNQHSQGQFSITQNGKWSGMDMFWLLNIFNRLFFLGKMSHSPTDIAIYWQQGMIAVQQAYGTTSHAIVNAGQPDERLIVTIRLDPGDYHLDRGVATHQIRIISTLLHEALHCFFLSCSCDTYHDPLGRCTRHGKVLWLEHQYHDLAWFHLACAVEIAMEKVTGVRVNMSCFGSLIRDILSGAVPPSAAEWKRFFRYCGWENACKLFDRLGLEEIKALHRILEGDVYVLQVWAEEGERNWPTDAVVVVNNKNTW